MTRRAVRATVLGLALLQACGAEPKPPPTTSPAAPAAPAPTPPPAAAGDADEDAPGTCGTEVCTADQFCEDLYKGHAADARGRPIDRRKCMPLPDACKATPTCACVTGQVAATHCTDTGGHVYVDDYPRRR